MRKSFENWTKDKEGKKPGVISNYAPAINRISEHYTNETGINIDIYQIKDLRILKEICAQYRRGGRFEEFGDEKHGLYRAAITAYICYYEDTATERRKCRRNYKVNNYMCYCRFNYIGLCHMWMMLR